MDSLWSEPPRKSNKVFESENELLMSDSVQPHGLYSPWNSPGQNTGVDSLSFLQGIFPSPGDLPNPGIEPRSPALQADSLPAEPQEKRKNTGVGSVSLLQWIFPTQESNQGLLHCRQILYQLSYQCFWAPETLKHGHKTSSRLVTNPLISQQILTVRFPWGGHWLICRIDQNLDSRLIKVCSQSR